MSAFKSPIPVLPLRDIVVFPNMIVRLFVGREKSVLALEEVMKTEQQILLVAQKDAGDDNPGENNIFKVGVIANVLQVLKLPDGAVKILIEGKHRVKVSEFLNKNKFLEAFCEEVTDTNFQGDEIEALRRTVAKEFDRYSKLNKNITEESLEAIRKASDPVMLSDSIAGHLNLTVEKKQELLEVSDVKKRLEQILEIIQGELSVLRVEKKIKTRVKNQMEKTQREYYLNEQMKAIQKELGDGPEGQDEITEIQEKIDKTKLSKEAKEKAVAELKKLKSMSPMSAESAVVRNYLDWLLTIPWRKKSRIKSDLNHAQEILDNDHFGLKKVKERIIEYLAVQHRSKKLKGPILCLVGPPGVGKTSLGKSVAKATNREFIRISLGGVRDESEIRGHRRTYIGSMPGKIIQSMKKAKTSNPLILLDEIDKMGYDFRGDPASAMLEVLDPEQNSTFSDHYLEVEYDLSDVMFITTANTFNMPRPLLDRMEVIQLSGYTEDEKAEIAKRHLIKKQVDNHGLNENEFLLKDKGLYEIIRHYTREAGVRNLEREISKLCRKVLTHIIKDKKKSVKVDEKNISDLLGVKKFKYGLAEESNQIGVATGLAWTEVGGDLLSIEAIKLPGKGRMKSTGKLGEVMKESIDAASSFVRSRSPSFGIIPTLFDKYDIHVHVPEGATPKDGPSAGIAMVTSIVSMLSETPIRRDVAMTGEVTLRGNVLPIGGLKEKLLAALRGGIKTVIIPIENVKDLAEIPDNVKNDLEIIPVTNVEEVLKVALSEKLQSIDWDFSEYENSDNLKGKKSAKLSYLTKLIYSKVNYFLSLRKKEANQLLMGD